MFVSHRWFTVALVAALAACSGGSSTPENTGTGQPAGGENLGTPQSMTNMPGDASTAPADAAASARQAPEPAMPAVTVTAGEITPVPANLHPRVAFTAPRENQVVRGNSVEVRLRVTDWPAPQDGRHIHLILDNEPYQRIDDPSRPIPLANLAEGTHVLRAFPGWATHESVKVAGAFAVVVFHVGRRTDNFGFTRTAPLLTYSRPKGAYNGTDAARILLDFYLSNVPNNNTLAANGTRVRYAIRRGTTDEATGEITSWVPHFIENLPNGEHTIVLDLLGSDGQPVNNMFNHTERTITVDRNAAAAPPHQHPAAAGTTPATGATATTGADAGAPHAGDAGH